MRASDAERDQILTVLQRGYETGRLDLAEMKERQDRALSATFLDELPLLIGDLPEGRLPPSATTPCLPRPRRTMWCRRRPRGRRFLGEHHVGRRSRRGVRDPPSAELRLVGRQHLRPDRGDGPGTDRHPHPRRGDGRQRHLCPRRVRVIDQSIAIMAGNDVSRDARGDGSNGTLVLKGFLWWAGNKVALAGSRRRAAVTADAPGVSSRGGGQLHALRLPRELQEHCEPEHAPLAQVTGVATAAFVFGIGPPVRRASVRLVPSMPSRSRRRSSSRSSRSSVAIASVSPPTVVPVKVAATPGTGSHHSAPPSRLGNCSLPAVRAAT
ncbi:DUF1707 domain-containing protein [Tessaracoccus sp. HDW20]|uniref:DUF1707 SHOCT-like domain-containing protein n=1 Tax=Tessaracoccus coleopterorum TaxID=2714950 RepID=UPI0018D3E1E3|nr:DUF1707 domain-containing protein [Tessaracoccus coleopterorum]NHB85274.1 DUF1707 domain-containing protein [Tessaracoccus coleopterorum]